MPRKSVGETAQAGQATAENGSGNAGASGMPLDYAGEHGLKRSEGGAMSDPSAQVDWSQHMSEDDFRAFDQAVQANVNPAELIVSRLAMMQSLSPEIKDHVLGYEEGMIIDNNTRQVYSVKGPPPWMAGKLSDPSKLEEQHYIRFVPVFKLPNEFMRWKRRNTEGKGWWWKTLNPKEVVDIRENMLRGEPIMAPAYKGTFKGGWKAAAGAEVKAPPTTENLNFIGVVIAEDGEILSPLMIATFAKTSAQAGSKFVSALNMHRAFRLPYFGRFYYLWSHYTQKGENKFYTLDMAQGGHTPNNPQLINIAVEMAKYLSDKEEGVTRQEAMISNAVDYDDDEVDSGDSFARSAAGDGGYVPTAAEAAASQQGGQHGGRSAPMTGEPAF